MIARSARSAALAVVAATLLGMALPQAAQARDHDEQGYGYQRVDHRDRDYDEHRGRRYEHREWRHHHERYRYAPRYYPDVAVYPAPRAYYYEPYYAPVEPVYPRDYGTVGIHLDYNLLY